MNYWTNRYHLKNSIKTIDLIKIDNFQTHKYIFWILEKLMVTGNKSSKLIVTDVRTQET